MLTAECLLESDATRVQWHMHVNATDVAVWAPYHHF